MSMSPTMQLQPRQVFYDDQCYIDQYTGRTRCQRTAWNTWVRWVVLGVVVLGFLFLFMLCSCITARRRRKAGRQPFYGTGWAARPGNNANTYNNSNAQPYYNNNTNGHYNNNAAPAPPYTAPNSNTGYYGGGNNGASQDYYGQQNGVELQNPQPTYGGNGGYAPPPGPPPGKGEGIVR